MAARLEPRRNLLARITSSCELHPKSTRKFIKIYKTKQKFQNILIKLCRIILFLNTNGTRASLAFELAALQRGDGHTWF
jgi:hypothetical protein